MLFNSYEFILVFLPLTLAAYWLSRVFLSVRFAISLLVLASLVFYGWWNPIYVPLLVGSALLNYQIGRWMQAAGRGRRALLVAGLVWNLGLLGYFKYADFFVATLRDLSGWPLPLPGVVLPLALSFFTFQKIAYLVDVYRGEATVRRLSDFLLFVTFFPQLIAGPIVHYRDIVPQIEHVPRSAPSAADWALGLSFFTVGLFKKVVLADGIAVQANELFALAGRGESLDLFLAWTACLSFTLQMYFDFSGYSDMALGLARLFGIKLPINFDSPLKASSIREFWRRWHISLSRFLHAYLYVPLGGSRGSLLQTAMVVLVVFVLSGIWHGAGWNYVVFGLFTGVLMVLHLLWSRARQRLGWGYRAWWDRYLAVVPTFLAFAVGMVIFRSPTLAQSGSILASMLGWHGAVLPGHWLQMLGSSGAALLDPLGIGAAEAARQLRSEDLLRIGALLFIALAMPNIYQMTAHFDVPHGASHETARGDATRLRWQPDLRWMLLMSVLAVIALLNLSTISEFLYFQF